MSDIELRNYLASRFDRIDDKLDSHLNRLAKVETTVKHQQGFIKTIIAVIVAMVGSVVSYITNRII